jgi:hypothetical protein
LVATHVTLQRCFAEVLTDIRGQSVLQTREHVEQSLLDSEITWSKAISVNHWKALMYGALARDRGFIDACV